MSTPGLGSRRISSFSHTTFNEASTRLYEPVQHSQLLFNLRLPRLPRMKITPDVFEAYLKCPTKCWLRSTDETSAGNTSSEWVKARNDSHRVNETRRLVAESPNDAVVLSPDMKDFKAAKWR
jgi:hypothetical protein